MWKDMERLRITNRNKQSKIKRDIREKFREWLDR